MIDPVECRSDYNYPGRPVAFWWDGLRLEVVDILDSRLTPRGKVFLVRAADDWTFELAFDELDDAWHIEKK